MHARVKLLLVCFQRNAMLASDAIAKKKKKKIKTINVASCFSSPQKEKNT